MAKIVFSLKNLPDDKIPLIENILSDGIDDGTEQWRSQANSAKQVLNLFLFINQYSRSSG